MGKKRKSAASTRLDEVDRNLYTSFCTAANSLSQLYTQSMNHQRLSFQAGERHSLYEGYRDCFFGIHTSLFLFRWPGTKIVDALKFQEKLYHWILRQQEDGTRVPTMDIVSYLQNELDAVLGDASMSPRVPVQHQNSQTAMHLPSSCGPVSSGQFRPAAPGQGFRPVNPDQHHGKDAVFSDALSSPVRRSLQHYHLTQGGYHTNSNMSALPSPSSNRRNNNEGLNSHHPTREANPTSSNDTSMDMNADGSLY